jgi:hypothetical protein
MIAILIALSTSVAPSHYIYSSFVDCGPPSSGSSVCNHDPDRSGAAMKNRLARCRARDVEAISATDGWAAFTFRSNRKVVFCLRNLAPPKDRIEPYELGRN